MLLRSSRLGLTALAFMSTVPLGCSTRSLSLAPCRTAQVSARVGDSNGYLGTILGEIVLHNHGATACSIEGYIGLALLDKRRKPMTAEVKHVGVTPAGFVRLLPGHDAAVGYSFYDNNVDEKPCPPSPAYLSITLPHDADVQIVSATGWMPCDPGREIHLTPVRPRPGPALTQDLG